MLLINDNIIKNFLDNLQNEGKSKVSIKNYKSDIAHFLAWATLKLKSFGTYAENISEITPFVSREFFNEYKNYMVENKIKIKTINRRLSSLRNFSHFLHSVHILDEDFMRGIQNAGIGIPTKMQEKSRDIVEKFRESLTKGEKVSPNTIKNYISDVRSFLAWVNQKGELPNGV
ncbi:MAG: site-specific integrase [Patescibacteria group bacterium]|nr:site-specific integrase [Patescibacteria group bacterium]